MASAIYGAGFLELSPKLDKNFSKDLESQTDSATQRIGDSMERTGGKLTKGLTLPLLAAGAGMFALAGRQEEAEAKMTSSFESMGASAWTTTDALKAQASALQEMTTFGDEEILDFQAIMLTFGNVTGEVFEDATRLGADMSAKLGTDLQSSATMIGKALNDPVKGLAAMSRVGIQFTADQEEMIKGMVEAGDVIGAQEIILGELEKQFGGTAEAMALTGKGQAKQAMNSLGDAGEQIGAILIPVVSKFAGWMKTLAERFQALSPEAKEWIVRIGAVAAAVGPVLIIGGKLIKSFGAIGKAFMVMSKIFMANPWILLIAAVVALVVIIVKNWDTIVDFLKGVWQWMKDAAGAVGDWISDAFKKAVEFVKNLFLNFTPLGLIIKNFDKIKALATGVKTWIIDKFNEAVNWLKGLPGKVSDAVSGLFQKVKDLAVEAKDWVFDRIADIVGFFRRMPGRISGVVGGLFNGLKTAFKNAVNWIIRKWNNFRLEIKLPDLLGGGKIGIDTPNIPLFHDGGMVDGPPGSQMLAILEAGERVLSKAEVAAGEGGGRGWSGDLNIQTVNAGPALAREVGGHVGWQLKTAGV